MGDDWRGWKNGRYDNRYRGVKRHSGQRGYKTPIIISAILGSVIIGYFVYQTYGIPQPIQNDAKIVINNASDTIQPILNKASQYATQVKNLNPVTQSNQQEPTLQIDSQWVHNFISIVNTYRQQKGLNPLEETRELDATAKQRFETMVTNYNVSHYGVTSNLAEEVFYPDGYTPQEYVTNLQNTAPLHWNGFFYPVGIYGYYIQTGPVVETIGDCSVSEIPSAGIDENQFYTQNGCTPTTGQATWLVIDMSYGASYNGSSTVHLCWSQNKGTTC